MLRACKQTITVDLCVEEALGVQWCLELAEDLNWNRNLIWTDTLTVAANYIQGHKVVATISPIMKDCIGIIS